MKTVWSIAGSDSGGGAGIQADLNTFHDFQVHGCTAVTALTAQNTLGVLDIQPASALNLSAQLMALKNDLRPAAIKLGMLYSPDLMACIALGLRDLPCPIIADPVLIASSGDKLHSHDFIQAYRDHIFPLADLITPNVLEAKAFTGIEIKSYADMEKAAAAILSLGASAVLIKGGDFDDNQLASDYYLDSEQSFWLNLPRVNTTHTHGTGCSFSSAIAANLALGWSLTDSIIIAKAYVHAGLCAPRHVGAGENPVGHLGSGQLKNHFPWMTNSPSPLPEPVEKITRPIGFYPIVDNLQDLTILCSKGISFIQLRVKNPGPDFELICEKALRVAEWFKVKLIVNDYFPPVIARVLPKQSRIGLDCFGSTLAMTGTHMGQEDLDGFPSARPYGISAHNLHELARAYSYHPAYLAMGPVFETKSKNLNYPSLGLDKLAFIASICPLPLVAIGGIEINQIPEILALGCSGVAFIGAAKALMQEGRYDRHFSLPHFSVESQQKLAQAKIVCIGAGGLAAGFLPYLAAAGVGEITLIDEDKISYSNLQRQILFSEKDLGKRKVDVAASYLSRLNSQISIHPIAQRLTVDNALDLLSGFDLILDGTDNYNSHYLINDFARHLKTPLIAASVFQDQGQLFYLAPHSGCYRCAFPQAPAPHERPNCSVAGVLGTTPGLLGIMQAQLAIEQLTGLLHEPSHKDRIISFCRTVDLARHRINQYLITADPNCPVCQHEHSLTTIRTLQMTTEIEQINVETLKQLMDAGEEIHLLDVREDDERAEFNIGGDHISIQVLPERINDLNDKLTYIVYCHSGGRSSMACQFLSSQGFKVKNLVGGMKAWRANITS